MKFTLTYSGDLSSSGNSSKKLEQKWSIRNQIDTQLRTLCQEHRVLSQIFDERRPVPVPASPFTPVDVDGISFMPIVCESASLVCGLNITFLRKEEPGNLVLQGGDIDNRIKTLLDALSVPLVGQTPPKSMQPEDTIFCLMESDALATNLAVKTDRLLASNTTSVHEVQLIIEVTVSVIEVRGAQNFWFLGD